MNCVFKIKLTNLIHVTMNIKFRRNLKLIKDEFGKSQTSLVLNLHHQIILPVPIQVEPLHR